jgi:hypothetical protein
LSGWESGGTTVFAALSLSPTQRNTTQPPPSKKGDRIIEGELSFDAIDALLDEASSSGASK